MYKLRLNVIYQKIFNNNVKKVNKCLNKSDIKVIYANKSDKKSKILKYRISKLEAMIELYRHGGLKLCLLDV